MKRSLDRLLAELIEFGRSHDAARSDRRERLRNLEPESANGSYRVRPGVNQQRTALPLG